MAAAAGVKYENMMTSGALKMFLAMHCSVFYPLLTLSPSLSLTPFPLSFCYTKNYVAWLRVLLMTAACCGVCDGFFAPRLLPVACCQLMSSLWQSHVASPPTTATTTTTSSVWRWWIASTLFGQGKGCRQKDCSNGLFCRNFSQLQQSFFSLQYHQSTNTRKFPQY